MDPIEQRIAIAEACGWKGVQHSGRGANNLIGLHPEQQGAFQYVPDYLNDLNAMHEAEKMLKRGQLYKYMLNMQNVKGLGGNNQWLNFRATAAQRAEAFLKTLNLWKD
jgi:hypothetical protein